MLNILTFPCSSSTGCSIHPRLRPISLHQLLLQTPAIVGVGEACCGSCRDWKCSPCCMRLYPCLSSTQNKMDWCYVRRGRLSGRCYL
ncbi:hypothetical protein K443DRAFT_318215 [Laccaria amethystina LaAM-08-1]|uniref:Uncharacterized protein n=1 Tax=Laccaria amethystina LaAM-08-1 TaxID=1095629 RepID=A0A0C9YCM4_9AGAR|nr:hypothetical protein K443DRAFT_318215 [Laccaria amethystina LaAM-08-1]